MDGLETTTSPRTTVISHKVIIYVIIGIAGFLGNGMVVYVIASYKPMIRHLSNYFLINQSAADMTGSFFVIVFSFVNYSRDDLTGLSGYLYCKIIEPKLFMWGSFLVSTYSLVIISLDRFMEVVHPLWCKAHKSRLAVCVIIVAVWVFGMASNAAYLVPTTYLEDGSCHIGMAWPSITVARFVSILIFIIQMVILLLVILVCYPWMARTLKGSVAATTSTLPSLTPSELARQEKNMKMSRSVTKTMFILSLCFVICWLPNQASYLLYLMGHPINISSFEFHITIYMMYLNLCINPIIYMAKHPQFRKAIKVVILRHTDEDKDNGTGKSSETQETRSTRA